MFTRIAAITTIALPILAAATAILPRQGSCNTGPIQCCSQVQAANTTTLASLGGLLGLDLGSITGLIGSASVKADSLYQGSSVEYRRRRQVRVLGQYQQDYSHSKSGFDLGIKGSVIKVQR
ncbi:hypothetical protein BD779DRAFT_1679263 [Infundibulicybe gibba]|nr:hypothetical protein BD779DRAFT_1679263 [Infundibulicybe gibba]